MKIVDNRIEEKPRSKNTADMSVGVVFRGRIGSYSSRVFLRAYGVTIDLANPSNTWPYAVDVEEYEPLRAHLVIEGEL